MQNLKSKAFTLVELMVVVIIISILTAIVTANFAQSKSKARDAKRISDLAQIQLSLELFFDRCNGYPTALTNPTSGVTISTCPSGITLGTFLSQIPTAPSQGLAYEYGVASGGADYVLKATLENNNQALVDVDHTKNYSTYSPAVNCTATLAYCVLPR